jgi:hypothetical protein
MDDPEQVPANRLRMELLRDCSDLDDIEEAENRSSAVTRVGSLAPQ